MVLNLRSDEEYSLSKWLIFSYFLFFISGVKKFKKFVKMKQRNAEKETHVATDFGNQREDTEKS